jgi:drug/metabolite transporter (DMT)-like permease
VTDAIAPLCVAFAATKTSPLHLGLFTALQPAVVAIVSHLAHLQRLPGVSQLALVVAVVGGAAAACAGAASAADTAATLFGDLLVLAADTLSAGSFLLSPLVYTGVPFANATFVNVSAGFVRALASLCAPFIALAFGSTAMEASVAAAVFWSQLGSLLILGAAGTAGANLLAVFATHRIGPASAAAYASLQPVLSTLAVWVFDGSFPNSGELGGIAIVIAGLTLLAYSVSRERSSGERMSRPGEKV